MRKMFIAVVVSVVASLALVATPSQAFTLDQGNAEAACASYSGPSVTSAMSSYGKTPMAWQVYSSINRHMPMSAPNRFSTSHIAVSIGWYDTGIVFAVSYRCGVTGSNASPTINSFGQEWIGYF